MLKLMKYEFKKTMFSKMVILVFTALAEAMFLAGLFLHWDKGLTIGTIGLTVCAWVGIMYIGIESLLVFHRDLNTKQSYMLFLTPRNSYQILGAKVLENGLSIFLAGAFFAALAALDSMAAVLYLEGLEEFLIVLKEIGYVWRIEMDISTYIVALTFFMVLASWLMLVVTGYFAILLSATVLSGKRFSGFVSFALFLTVAFIFYSLLGLVPEDAFSQTGYMWFMIFAVLVMALAVYAVSGWIMERKLSV